MRISNDYLLKTIADEHIIVPIGNAVDINSMITLNDTGAFVWVNIENGLTADQIANELVKEYDIDLATAKVDINNCIQKLIEYGMVIND